MDKMPLTRSILKVLFLLAAIGVQAVFAAKHSVAVLPSEDVLSQDELDFSRARLPMYSYIRIR
jgi:hypothetical protein